jgi:hypothetical protein
MRALAFLVCWVGIASADPPLEVEAELEVHGEVIHVEGRWRPQPAKPAEPKVDAQKTPPYSDEAVERDAWARAWLLLDVDETGKVTRLKLLKKPGFDLDAIAIRAGFELRFEPARDAHGKPMKTYIVWSMEWPSYGWLVQRNGSALRMPRNIHVRAASDAEPERGIAVPWRPLASGIPIEQPFAAVPCAGTGPLNLDLWNPAYRDCSRPDMHAADALPWITRETADAAVAELAAVDREIPRPVVTGSRVPSIVSTSITAGFAIALVASYRQYLHYATAEPGDPVTYHENVAARDKWAKVSLVLSGAVVVSSGVTLFLWNRHQSKRSFSVQPTTAGATASFGLSF